jgi:thiamine thiazole synthase
MTSSFKSTIASLSLNDVKTGPTNTDNRLAPPAKFDASVKAPLSPPSSVKSLASVQTETYPVEDYEGNYRFAPIKESQVAIEMSRRYGDDLVNTAISDVVIIGAGSAGLSCAYELAKNAPHLKVTIIEAGVAPGGGAWVSGQLMSAMIVRVRLASIPDTCGNLGGS